MVDDAFRACLSHEHRTCPGLRSLAFCHRQHVEFGVSVGLLFHVSHRIAYYASMVFIGALTISICAGVFHSRRSISASQLVDTYLPDPATRADIEQRLHLLTPHHKIELRHDGTFAMTDIPDFWQPTETPTALISATGTWSPRPERWRHRIYTGATVIPPTDTPEHRYSATIDVIGFFAPYKLRVILGDPDSSYNATFTKTQ